MTNPEPSGSDLRSSLIDGLQAARAVEREIFAALSPDERDGPDADGGWSPKDVLAHLSAWRQQYADKMAATRTGQAAESTDATEIDAINATLHTERAAWAWERVDTDADVTTEALVAEVGAADGGAIADPKVVGTVMGDGPEHDLAHLGGIARRVGLEARVLDLADATQALIERGDWPSRPTAFARYNLACFHALGGRLDRARALLREALPVEEELRTLAPMDDDLIALRDEIRTLIAG